SCENRTAPPGNSPRATPPPCPRSRLLSGGEGGASESGLLHTVANRGIRVVGIIRDCLQRATQPIHHHALRSGLLPCHSLPLTQVSDNGGSHGRPLAFIVLPPILEVLGHDGRQLSLVVLRARTLGRRGEGFDCSVQCVVVFRA